MKAVRLLEYGGQLVFTDVPTPTIAPDEMLVKVKSTAVNHLDLVEGSGALRQVLPIDLPWIPGHEFSGVVDQIGSDVTAYAPGDAVFGTSGGTSGGAYAEYVAAKPAAPGPPSQRNHPTSPSTRRHQCRWPPKRRGRESSRTATWKRDKRS